MTLALHGKSGRRKAVLLIAALAAILLAIAGGTVMRSSPAGAYSGIVADVFLMIDEDTIDNGIGSIEDLADDFNCGGGNPAVCVNDDIANLYVRTELFSRPTGAFVRPHAGLVLPVPSGSDRGVFMFTNPEAAVQVSAQNGATFTIPELIAASGATANENNLDKVNGVKALTTADLEVGWTVCALVWDSDISNTGTDQHSLKGATMGLTAFTITAKTASTITVTIAADLTFCQAAPQDRQIRVVKIVEGEGSSLDPTFAGTITPDGNWSLKNDESQVFTRPTTNQTVVETTNLATLSSSDANGTWSFGGYAQISQGYASNADAVAACRALSSGSFSGTQAGGKTTSGTGNLTVCVKNKFTPDEPDPEADVRISIEPLDEANEVGSNHVLTILLEKQIDGGAWQAFAGEEVTASITNTLGATATFVGSPSCTTDGDGECTVTITSSTAGTTTIDATWAGGTVNTVSVGARTTDPDAIKRWVAVRLLISPLQDTNPLNTNHVFTLTLEQSVQHNVWTPLVGETIDVEITADSADSSFVGPSSCETEANGQCTVTIVSDEEGTTEVKATWAGGTVADATISSKTATATKDWGDINVRISISPLDEANEVSSNHVLTILLEWSEDSGTTWSPLAGEQVTASLANTLGATASFVGSPSCTTDSDGKCTVTISSPTAGSTTISATWAGGEVVGTEVTATVSARTTDPDANKDWVAVRLLISPLQDTNPLNTNHVFTLTLEQSVQHNVWTPLAGETIDVEITADSANSSFVGPSSCETEANGQCTVTIVSDEEGTTEVKATWAGGTVADATISSKTATATKDWGDINVRISISPLDDANEVGSNHVLTILLEWTEDGGTTWKPLAGEQLTASLANTLGATASFVGSPSCTTDGDGECTVTISSPTSGSTTISATWAGGEVEGTAVTATVSAKTTNPDANKDWVAVRLLITPLQDVNPVGTTHTFTITLQQSVVAGAWTPLDDELITVSFTANTAGASFVGGVDTCTTGTTGPGQCQVTITAPNEGTSTVQATWAGGTVAGASITQKSATAVKDWEELEPDERIIRIVKVVDVDGEGSAPSVGFDGLFDATAWTLFNNDFRHFIRVVEQSHHVVETEDLDALDGDWEFGGYAELPGLASAADCRAANYTSSPAQGDGFDTSDGEGNITVCVRNIFTPEEEPELFIIRIVKVVDQGEATFTGTLNATNWSLAQNSFADFIRGAGSYTVTENALAAQWIFGGYVVLNGLPADPVAACQDVDYSASPTQAQGIGFTLSGDVTVCVSNVFDDEVVAPSAPFIVKKTFDDGTTHTVTVKLECTSGTVTLNIAPGNPGTFIVTDFTGELDDVECTATEVNVPSGYTSTACKATLEDGECTIQNKKIADAATPIPPKAGTGFGAGGSTPPLSIVFAVLGLMAITLGAASMALLRRPRITG